MSSNDNLGTFEQAILTSVSVLDENAYGATVHEKVEELTERTRCIGRVYTALDRLEEKGTSSRGLGTQRRSVEDVPSGTSKSPERDSGFSEPP